MKPDLTTMHIMQRTSSLGGTWPALSLGVLCGTLCGCAVHLIAPYDVGLDVGMTHVQQTSEVFLSQLAADAGTPAASYAQSHAYYVQVEAELRTMLTRAQVVPRNDRVSDQISNIETTVEIIEGMHKRNGTLSAATLVTDRGLLESQFRSFFALELGLRTRLGTPPNNAFAPGKS